MSRSNTHKTFSSFSLLRVGLLTALLSILFTFPSFASDYSGSFNFPNAQYNNPQPINVNLVEFDSYPFIHGAYYQITGFYNISVTAPSSALTTPRIYNPTIVFDGGSDYIGVVRNGTGTYMNKQVSESHAFTAVVQYQQNSRTPSLSLIGTWSSSGTQATGTNFAFNWEFTDVLIQRIEVLDETTLNMIESTAYSRGWSDGWQDGWETGQDQGIGVGYNFGYTDGYDEGYTTGSAYGYAVGYQAGLASAPTTPSSPDGEAPDYVDTSLPSPWSPVCVYEGRTGYVSPALFLDYFVPSHTYYVETIGARGVRTHLGSNTIGTDTKLTWKDYETYWKYQTGPTGSTAQGEVSKSYDVSAGLNRSITFYQYGVQLPAFILGGQFSYLELPGNYDIRVWDYGSEDEYVRNSELESTITSIDSGVTDLIASEDSIFSQASNNLATFAFPEIQDGFGALSFIGSFITSFYEASGSFGVAVTLMFVLSIIGSAIGWYKDKSDD